MFSPAGAFLLSDYFYYNFLMLLCIFNIEYLWLLLEVIQKLMGY